MSDEKPSVSRRWIIARTKSIESKNRNNEPNNLSQKESPKFFIAFFPAFKSKAKIIIDIRKIKKNVKR